VTKGRVHIYLAAIIFVVANGVHAQQQRVSWGDTDREVLIWNQRPSEAMFVTSRFETQTDGGMGLLYRDRGFSVSLLQPLSFSSTGGYFVWWVTLDHQPGLRMICFRRDTDKQFGATDIGANLQDLGELKLIKTGSGARFLFAVAGDGQLRLVSATNAAEKHLFIDYTAAGQVERIRDDFGREATLQYEGGQVRRLMQTWVEHGNKYLTAAVLK
jgi:hypothetical protein